MTDSNYSENISLINKLFERIGEYDRRLLVFAVCSMIIMTFVLYSFIFRNVQSTDNAVVRCDKIDVISEVSGILEDIYITDNTYLKEGTLLAKIDDSILSSKNRQAVSELELAEAELLSYRSNMELVALKQQSNSVISLASLDASKYQKEFVSKQISELRSKLAAVEETVDQTKRNLNRETKLSEDKLISTSQLDDTRLKYRLSLAERDGVLSRLESMLALEKVRQAEIAQSQEGFRTLDDVSRNTVEEAHAQTLNALAKVNLAREKVKHSGLLLDKSNISAMRSGYATNTRIYEGDFVEVGQPIASIISCGESAWVEANFKETQITKMVQGQKSEFRLDTYPDTLITGTVDGLSYGSGATFSVLPPENAVGNYTKVVQRFPVRIRIDPAEGVDLRAGMSAVVKVYTEKL